MVYTIAYMQIVCVTYAGRNVSAAHTGSEIAKILSHVIYSRYVSSALIGQNPAHLN